MREVTTYVRCEADGRVVTLTFIEVDTGMPGGPPASMWYPRIRRYGPLPQPFISMSLSIGPWLCSDPWASTDRVLADPFVLERLAA